jgi:hypothetical protein
MLLLLLLLLLLALLLLALVGWNGGMGWLQLVRACTLVGLRCRRELFLPLA